MLHPREKPDVKGDTVPETEAPPSSRGWASAPGCRIALYLTVGVCIIILCAPCVWAIRMNVFAPSITRDFETVELLLDEESMPPGWRIDDTHTDFGLSSESWSDDRAGRFYIRYDEDGARLTRATITAWHYNYPDPRDYEHVFSTSLRYWDPPPPEITFTSRYADEWAIRCVIANPEIYACAYSASYSEFLVDVWIKIARGDAPEDLFISPEEINGIFAAQDQRVANFLDLGLQEVTTSTIVCFSLACLVGMLFSGWLGFMAWAMPKRHLAWVRKWRIPFIGPLSDQERLAWDRITTLLVFVIYLIGLVYDIRRYLLPFFHLRR